MLKSFWLKETLVFTNTAKWRWNVGIQTFWRVAGAPECLSQSMWEALAVVLAKTSPLADPKRLCCSNLKFETIKIRNAEMLHKWCAIQQVRLSLLNRGRPASSAAASAVSSPASFGFAGFVWYLGGSGNCPSINLMLPFLHWVSTNFKGWFLPIYLLLEKGFFGDSLSNCECLRCWSRFGISRLPEGIR